MTHGDTLIRTDTEDLLLAGLVELSRGNEEAALEAFVALLAACDESRLATLCAAQLFMKRRDYPGAAALLEPLAAREPEAPGAHFMLGQAYRGMHRTIEAIQSYRAALELDAEDAAAREALDELATAQEP